MERGVVGARGGGSGRPWFLAAFLVVLLVVGVSGPGSLSGAAEPGPQVAARTADELMAETERRHQVIVGLMERNEAAVLRVLEADPESVREATMGPIDAWGFAAANGFTNLLRQVLKQLGLPKPDPMRSGTTPPLACAALGGWPDCVRMLLEAGADPNENSGWAGTPAFHLIQGHHGTCMLPGLDSMRSAPPEQRARAVELLLAAGANLFLATTNSLEIAPLRGAHGLPEEVVVRLLTLARPERQGNPRGDTLLHAAAALGSTQSVAVLVARGVSVHVTNAVGWTPLHSLAATSLDPDATGGGMRPWFGGVPEWMIWTSGYQLSVTSRVMMARQLVSLGARHDIFTAAGMGDERALTEVLARNPGSIRARDARGRTALHWAASGGQSAIIPKLMAAGADPSAVDREGNTALHLGLVTQPPVTLEALIEARVPLDRPNSNRQVALALVLQDRPALERLLRAGASVDPAGAEAPLLRAAEIMTRRVSFRNRMPTPIQMPGMVPLGRGIAQSPEMEAIRRLLTAGARLSSTNRQGQTSLELACRAAALNLVEVLVKAGADLNAPTIAGEPIWMAALHGRGDAVYDEDPSWRFRAVSQLPSQAGQALQSAGIAPAPPRARKEDVLPFLQRLGAQLKTADAQGQTALHRLAVGDGTPRLDRFFLPDALDDSPHPALAMRYSFVGRAEPPVGLLLEAGVAVDARDREGNTAWLLAWQHVRPDVARALRKAGADVHATNRLGRNALHLLCLPEPTTLRVGESFTNVLPKFNGPVIGHLVKHGVNPKAVDAEGRTPLHFAVDPQHPIFVAVELVENGADARVKDRSGKSPLDLAQNYGRQDLVDFFNDPVGKHPFRQEAVPPPPAP